MGRFVRNNISLSLCGLNCRLCSMYLGGHCPGCGAGNRPCRIARCSLEHDCVEYCFQCSAYPCGHYEQVDTFDSFITHQRQKADLARAREIGVEQYNREQAEKAAFLRTLLSQYNDGRKKTFYCTAVNLLPLSDLKEVWRQITGNGALDALPWKEQCAYVSGLLQEIAQSRRIELKLRKKRNTDAKKERTP